LVLSIDGIE